MFDKYINKLIVTKVFSFNEDKMMMLNKVPFVFFPARSMAKFIQKTYDDLGDEEMDRIAYDAGLMVAKEFVEQFKWIDSSLPGKMAGIRKMFEVMGFGSLDIKIWNAKDNKWLVNVTKHPVIDEAIKLFGDKEKSCSFYMGIYSAHLHNELGIENCHLKETQCMSRGAKFCEWSFNIFNKKG